MALDGAPLRMKQEEARAGLFCRRNPACQTGLAASARTRGNANTGV
jgi:hypothetical protein